MKKTVSFKAIFAILSLIELLTIVIFIADININSTKLISPSIVFVSVSTYAVLLLISLIWLVILIANAVRNGKLSRGRLIAGSIFATAIAIIYAIAIAKYASGRITEHMLFSGSNLKAEKVYFAVHDIRRNRAGRYYAQIGDFHNGRFVRVYLDAEKLSTLPRRPNGWCVLLTVERAGSAARIVGLSHGTGGHYILKDCKGEARIPSSFL